ncbi:MAG: ExbD/TolR family protein [Paracoccus sp. (in: a-proteobacteria)]|uniref:ExbD/TolR family protein n=2 Tax=unclassified Paracoccus (in: a-proteobacteria) TaxID=2688777 RepID=UPI000C5D8FBD|nr:MULTISPECIES: ExbD/TolR family protein [unclassified Paracoccus (in: a-proteobacteria)]MBA49542.1 protein TolR [Paracoccus sp. (in: a-proteobacteria)]MDB2552697.1 ExbD/TolR family protein [Paracoccus sp. (in: a-proteobacteria)]|tara:strand:- start:751 stop:1203 length:453 start_codon:yes stop_codon:yes gene_type:complete
MADVVKRISRRKSGRRRNAPMSEINVTPFVDVMLVLLVIFMVAAPLMTAGVPLNLPRTAATAVPTEPEEPLVISIPAEGQITLMNNPLADNQIVARLRAVLAERQSDRIFLRADGTIPYARVVQVMGALNAAGLTNIVLVTDPGGPRMDG